MFAILSGTSCHAFDHSFMFRRRHRTTRAHFTATTVTAMVDDVGDGRRRLTTLKASTLATTRDEFFDALDTPYSLNGISESRTELVDDLIRFGGGLPNPGSRETFASVAPGSWDVVYAPHMTHISNLLGCELSVQVSPFPPPKSDECRNTGPFFLHDGSPLS
jgi:hypothetical protein